MHEEVGPVVEQADSVVDRSVGELEDPVHRALYEDAHNDQTTWNIFAFLILFGAAFAAFNLVSRAVDAQRREIGIGMALGLPPRLLALPSPITQIFASANARSSTP